MNEVTIRKWYDVFKDNNELVEIRILDPKTKRSYSGYFTDIETILKEIKNFDSCNLYFTLNVINDACYSREQHDRICLNPKSTTSDGDIIARRWCLIDIDCEKPSDTNSTDEEKELAKEVVNKVYKFLRDEGFEQPVICDSANGFHALYRQAMLSTKENTATMEKFLKVLDMLFSTDKVKVDTAVANPSRICKLYGAISRKGYNTKDRPQRESKILRVPDDIKATPNEYFEKVANMFPKEEQPTRYNNYNTPAFDLDEFIRKYNIGISRTIKEKNYTKYVLEVCPFDASHHAPDAAIFRMDNGAISFKCLHNSDSNKTWADVRRLYEPNAYERRYENRWNVQPRYNRDIQQEFIPQEKNESKGNVWLKLGDIQKVKLDASDFITTGITDLDRLGLGLKRKYLTVLTGLRSSGKTSLINMMILNQIQNKYNIGLWSGEMDGGDIKQWMYLQAAGKNNVQKRGESEYYETSESTDKKISEWVDKYFSLYSNKYSSDISQLVNEIKERHKTEFFDVIYIDNLMVIGDDSLSGTTIEKNKKTLLMLHSLAEELNIHIVLVAHPNKNTGLLRLSMISGTADISNIAQNVLLWHRVRYSEHEFIHDFERDYEEFFGRGSFEKVSDYSNILEIAKFRSKGTLMGKVFGMFYEKETGRFKNSIAEHIVYGWEESKAEDDYNEITYDDDDMMGVFNSIRTEDIPF